MSLSDDGNRAYVADPTGRNLLIMDTSQIQARKPNPEVREVSRITWQPASIPQNAIPFSRNGHPYVLEFDEYNAATLGSGSADDVGAARIIDIADETHPHVIANLRLEINQPGRPQSGGRRSRRDEPRAGLRRALLQPADASRPDDRRVLVHRLGPARVRHLRADQAAGDRLLRGTHQGARRKPGAGLKLRDVAAGVRAGAARDLVQRRHERLQRAALRVTVDLRGLSESKATLRVRVRLRGGRTITARRVYHPCSAQR